MDQATDVVVHFVDWNDWQRRLRSRRRETLTVLKHRIRTWVKQIKNECNKCVKNNYKSEERRTRVEPPCSRTKSTSKALWIKKNILNKVNILWTSTSQLWSVTTSHQGWSMTKDKPKTCIFVCFRCVRRHEPTTIRDKDVWEWIGSFEYHWIRLRQIVLSWYEEALYVWKT